MIRTFTLGLVVLIIGCGPFTISPDQSETKSTDVEHISSADIWLALARAVENKAILTSGRLAQFIVVLTRHGELSTHDVDRFDQAFPGAVASDRPLDADDVRRLRLLWDESPTSLAK